MRLSPDAVQLLRGVLESAPVGSWNGYSVPLGLVVAVMQASEQALRREGLQAAADDWHGLLLAFLARQRSLRRLEGEDLPQTARPTPPSAPPRWKGQTRPGRRIPGLRGDELA